MGSVNDQQTELTAQTAPLGCLSWSQLTNCQRLSLPTITGVAKQSYFVSRGPLLYFAGEGKRQELSLPCKVCLSGDNISQATDSICKRTIIGTILTFEDLPGPTQSNVMVCKSFFILYQSILNVQSWFVIHAKYAYIDTHTHTMCYIV